jgi:methionine-rich copper-binding protein CopC
MANAAKIANFLVTAGETLKGAGGDKVTAASAGDAILKSLVNSVNSAGSTGVIDLGNASLLTTVLTDSAKEVAKTVTGTTDNFAAKITAMAATVASVIKDATDNIAAVVATGGSSDTLLTSMGNVSKFTQEGASAKLQDIAKTLDPANATAILASAVTSLTGDAADKSISKGSSTPEPVTPVVVPVTPPPDVTPADTTPPALSSSTPSDNATGVLLSSNIVLNFNESVRLGTMGNIVITNAVDINDTRTISVTDTTQVSVLGSTLTINPSNDLKAGYDYNVKFASGVVTDLAGNAFAGISDATTLNFTTVTNGTTASPVTTETSGNDIINGNQGSLTSGIVTFTATGNDNYIFNTVKTGSTPSDAYVQIGGFGSGDKLIFHVANTLEQAINTRYSFSDDGTDTIIYANDDDGMLFITLLGIHGLTISEPINNKTDFVALFGNSAITFI